MAWGAQQWLRATKESTYGTYNSGASSGDIWWIRLHQNNPFTMRPDVSKTRKVIRSADGGNRRRQVVNARTVIGGRLVTPFYPTQAGFLLGWASTLTSNDLPSYTLDFYDTLRTRRYLGVKIDQLQISGGDDSDYYTASLDLVGAQQAGSDPTLAQPADSVFPTELPYLHVETAGQISYQSTTLVKYKQFQMTIKNMLRGHFDENQYIDSLYYTGRDIDYQFVPQYLSTSWRSYFEAQTALTVAAGFSRGSPSHSLALNFETNSYLADLPPEDLPLDEAAYTSIGLQSFYDGSNSTDFAFTAS
jgi:hypothetical protein